MRRKSAGKKIMVVLVAASLALTPAELTVAAEMETENVEASFSEEENGDTASSDQEDSAEVEAEIADGSAAIEEQETTDTDKPDTGNNVQENAETGVMESGEEAPEGTAEEEDPETPEAAMDAAEALEECEQAEENAAFDDGTKDAVQASAEYSDGKFTWVLDGNGTLTITGNNMELTKNEISGNPWKCRHEYAGAMLLRCAKYRECGDIRCSGCAERYVWKMYRAEKGYIKKWSEVYWRGCLSRLQQSGGCDI